MTKVLFGLIGILLMLAVYSGVVALVGYTMKVYPTTQGILFGLAVYSAFVAFAPKREDKIEKIEQAIFGFAVPFLVTYAVSLH